MKKLFAVVVALAGLAVMVPSASAWTPQECADWYAEHGSNHPDCEWYVPPPPPEPKQIDVCRDGVIVTIPETERQLHDTNPPCPAPPNPPEPPDDEYVPPTPTPPPPDTPDQPDDDYVPPPIDIEDEPEADIGTPEVVAGEEQVPSNPEVVETDLDGKLPLTGFPVLVTALLGGCLAAGGAALRRRARP